MNIDMIRAAARRLEGHVRRTPLLNSPFLDDIAGRRVWVKPECLQHTGSFKFRGGWSAVSALEPSVRAKGSSPFPVATTPKVLPMRPSCTGCPR